MEFAESQHCLTLPQETAGALWSKGWGPWLVLLLKKKKLSFSLNEHKYIDIQIGLFLRSNPRPKEYNRIFTKLETPKP